MLLRSLACLIFAALFASTVSAELYQWKDAQGKVHFSDKKPDAAASETLALPNNGAMQPFDARPATPKVFSTVRGTQRPLLVRSARIALDDTAKADPVVGSYYFGPDCVSPSAITLSSMRQRHPELDQPGYGTTTISELSRYGFGGMGWNAAYAKQPINVVLDIVVTDLQILACARKIRRDSKYTSVDFMHSAARIVVKWTFSNAFDGKVIYETTTEGVVNVPAAKVQAMSEALRLAYVNAVQHLLEDDSLSTLLTQAKPIEQPEPVLMETNRFEEFLKIPKALYDRYMLTGRLAEILSFMSKVKAQTSEYYFSNGIWPSSLDQLDLSPADLTLPDRVASITLGSEGTIAADISPALGAESQLVLLPEPPAVPGGVMRWRCAAAIDSPTLQQWLLETCGR
jgi:hypothetical protein